MSTGCRLAAVILTLGMTTWAGCQQPSATNHGAGTKDAEPASAFIERPRVLDESGKVVSESIFPPGQSKVVLQLAHGPNFWATRDVKINGREIGWMLIDTGANLSTIDEMVADELGLKGLKPGQGGDYKHLRAIDRIEWGGIALNNHLVAVTDFASVRASYGVAIRGSLGGDFLGPVPFRLDFTEATLTFYARKNFKPPAGAREVRIQLSGKATSGSVYARAAPFTGIPAVNGRIGGVNCDVTLDTGASCALVVSPRLCREHPELVDWERGVQSSMAVAGGSADLCWAKIGEVGLFGQTIKIPEAYAQTRDTGFVLSADDLDAVAGIRLLENYRLTFDYAAGQMWIEERPMPSVAVRLAASMDPNEPDLAHATPLMVAAARGDFKGVKALLKAGARANGSDSVGRTALRFAVLGGNADVVQAVLNANSANVNEQTAKGDTALMAAMGKPSEETLIKMLLEAGADVTLKDSDGETAVHYAARRSSGVAIDLLAAKHANFNGANNKGWRPLDLAAAAGRVGAFKALWRAGARPAGKDGLTLLHLATANSNAAMIRHVLEGREFSVDVDARATDGTTPLMCAAQEGTVEAAELLLNAGAQADFIAGVTRGRTALIAAVQNNHPEVVELLLKHKANPEQMTADGTTALMVAADTSPEALTLLLKHGAKVNATRPDGATALHFAAQEGNPATAQLLLAVARKHVEVIRVLLAAGADPQAATTDGQTPLEVARLTGNAEAVKLIEEAIAKRAAATKPAKS